MSKYYQNRYDRAMNDIEMMVKSGSAEWAISKTIRRSMYGLTDDERLNILQKFYPYVKTWGISHWYPIKKDLFKKFVTFCPDVVQHIDLYNMSTVHTKVLITTYPYLLKKYDWDKLNIVGDEWIRIYKNNAELRQYLPPDFIARTAEQAVVAGLAGGRKKVKEFQF